MKAKHSIWKSKLAKTMFLTTVVLVAALFMGSAASAAIKAVGTGETNTQDYSDLCATLGLPVGTLDVQQPAQPTLNAQKTTGRAPLSAYPSVEGQQATLGGKGMFYAYDLYTYYTCTFDQDAIINNLAYAGIYFFSGADMDPDGNWYTVSYYGGLYSIDKDTGVYTYIAYCIPLNGMTYDSTSFTWYACGYNPSYVDAIFTIDITNGVTTEIGTTGVANLMISLMCDSFGNMYAYDVLFGGNSHLYSIDKGTGQAYDPKDMGHNFCFAQDGCFDRTYGDNTLYLAAYDLGQGQSYLATCDVDSGSVTILNLFSPMDEIDALAIPYTLVQSEHDVGASKVKAPVSGTAGVISPEITVRNYGLNDEYFPTEVMISKKVYSNYLIEDFEGSFPPAGWTVQTIFGGSWRRNDYWSTPDTNYLGTGYCADANMPKEMSAPMLTLLTTPPMDLSAVPGALLDVNSYQYCYYYDFFLIDVSVDGGTTWDNIYKVSETYKYGEIKLIQKNLEEYCGYSDVRIRFGFWSMFSWEPTVWQIDNVKVRSYVWDLEYDDFVYTYLGAGMMTNLTFPAWTPADLGLSENVDLEYEAVAQTLLYGDEQPLNDMKAKEFALHYGYFHDVAVTGIPSPVSGLAQTQPVTVSLKNLGQNAETVNVNVQIGKITNPEVIYFEGFDDGVLPPGWGTTDLNNWYVQYSNMAGGIAPELIFNWYPNIIGTSMCYTGPIDTTGYGALQLSFKQYVDDYATDYDLEVQTSTNGVDWTTVYTQAGGSYGPTTTTVGITGGSATLQIAFVFMGDSFNIDYWYIDDVEIDSLPMVVEYESNAMANINSGQTIDVSLDPWTPEDLPLADIDYVVTATATLNGVSTIGTYGFEDWVPGSGATWPPTGYSIYDYDGNYNTWWQAGWGSYYAHTGSYSMYTYDYGAEDNWFVSPMITVPGDGGAGFGAYMTGWWGYYGHTVEFWFCPYGSDPYTFLYGGGTLLGSAFVWGTYWNWQYYSVDTTSIAGQTGYFAIRDTSYYAYDYLFVDDIVYPDGTTLGFEPTLGYFPDWTSYVLSGSYNWEGSSYASSPPYNYPNSGTYMALYPGWYASAGSQARLQSDDSIDLSSLGYDQYQGSLWMYHDAYYSGSGSVEFQVSTDGSTWTTLATFYRYDPSWPGWVQHAVDLSAYASETTVYFGFLATSDWWGQISIDDLALNGLGFIPDGYPDNNVLSKMITLSYVHDVGIDSILPPAKDQSKDLIWDNGAHTTNALSSQLDTAYPFNSQVADDFMFDKTMDVTQVAFEGLFWNGYAINPIDLNVIFYADDGSGNMPTGAGMEDPTSTALQFETHAQVMGTDNGDGSFTYDILLDAPFVADANTKYWFVAQWFGNYPPQWGICVSLSQQLHNCMQGFPLLGYNYWTDPGYGDVSFRLMGQEHSAGGGAYPPGTYSLNAKVKNFGVTFTESDIPVEAKITFVPNGSIIYDETGVFAGPLAPGAAGTMSFPDFTLQGYTAWEGKYKIEVWTSLPNDDNPSNNKKSMTIEMAIPDVLPPITDHSMTGTMGLNGWYVSNVVITLTATDPFPPMFDPKPPSGVNHTYYKLHAADPWIEYTAPVTVNTDGQYELFYYSIDKAGNAEPQKGPFAFKIDKTAPDFISFTATAQNAMKTKWLLAAELSDPASGVARVEFYVDDQLVGNATAAPWEFTYQGNGKMAQAIAYDNAGNSAMSDQIQSLALVLSQPMNGQMSFQQNPQLK